MDCAQHELRWQRWTAYAVGQRLCSSRTGSTMQPPATEGSITIPAVMRTMQTMSESLQAVRLLVIIPAFNEEASIGRVIAQVQESVPNADIVVINDGSTDATAHIADRGGAVVLDLPHNLGIG